MKKTGIMLCMIALVCFIGMPVFAGGDQESGTTEAETHVLKLAHTHNLEHPYHLGLLEFEKVLEESSNSRIQVEIYPTGQLGSEAEMLEQCKIGSLDGLICGRFSSTIPALEALGLPFLFRDYDHVNKVLSGPVGTEIAELAEKNDLVLLDYAHSGLRQITNNVREIKTPDDLKGIKLRCPPIDVILEAMDALGASVVPLPYPEVYMALKTGVADGQENPFVNIASEKFYEVQKYMSVCNYIYIPSPLWFSLSTWNKLSPEDQKLVKDAAEKGCAVADAEVEATEEHYRQLIADSGVAVYELTPEEKALFIEKTASVYQWAKDKGYITDEMIEAIRNTK